MPGTPKKGKHSSKKNPCPVCGNTTGSCKLNDDGSLYCYHSLGDSAPSGYIYIRELSSGMGQEFITPLVADELFRAATELQNRGKKASSTEIAQLTGLPNSWARALQQAYPSKFRECNDYNYHRSRIVVKPKHQMHNNQRQNHPQPQMKVLSEEERDKHYRVILTQLQLTDAHHNHLTDVRRLSEFIDFIGFRSWETKQVEHISANLPGVVERNGSLYLYGQPGLFLPIYNELRQIIAFQLLPDDRSSGKYKWGSSTPVDGNGPRLDNGEMPLAFCHPLSIQLSSIGLAEGVLKAHSVACHLQQIIIGAPGAAWDCSPKLLRRYLENIAQSRNISLSKLVIDLYVDAGMISNRQIMLRYYETVKLLQKWGCKIRVGWWEQLTKDKQDIDDLIIQGGRHQITYISVDEWISLWPDNIRNDFLYKNVQFNTADWVAPVQHPDRSELGYWKKIKASGGDVKWQWIPKAGFSFIVERELIGTNNAFGGLVLQVKRSYDSANEQDRVVVPAEALHRVTDFINCLSRSTGKVYLVNKLKPEELHQYLHKELAAYRERGGKGYKLSERLGRQSDGTWVFPNCQISADGKKQTEEQSLWVLNEALIAKEKIPIPKINTEHEAEVLPRLVSAMRNFFGESGFMSAFFTTAFSVAGLFYDEIQEAEGFFPVLGLYGDAGTGKTVAAVTALSLLGFDHRAKINQTSESAYHERFKLMGGLTQFLDDPDKTQISWVCQQIKTQFGGGSRSVRENNQDPHSPLIVASNYSIGDNDPIILSRLIRLEFAGNPNPPAFPELRAISRMCSSALPDFIKLGYHQQGIKDLESQLISKLPTAHARLASSLALVGYYAFRLAELSGVVLAEEVWAYLSYLCGEANEDESKKSSLDDFIDKLLVLRSQTEVGEWNCRLITEDGNPENHNYKSLAVYIHSVWPVMSRYFKSELPYSQKMIRQQIQKAGGKTYSKQKFHCDKDSSIAYQRCQLNVRADVNGEIIVPKSPQMATRSCVEIPIELLQGRINSFELAGQTNFSVDYGNSQNLVTISNEATS
ncbi:MULTISPECIES: hypothetical protein [unclassified Tolypothrix]|uniref:hypothetical protein n=1 Tax=unclassified Tolypothrix TaxID=2649714 RepID=UPI000AB7572F|nr:MULTISPECIES: hypothetical protein [unclassified Tolypothrix]MBE9081691.1 hypothetical protein [Tolypothrix sp. LEGE 11397]UYD36678.1 hypothetical protein HG267_13655 [Tolypothrix sp. PCC 7601]BAY93638.1 hypothetical protein NIES3275_56800 [Microchaete diplosiphon NIES-3275]